MQMNTLHIMQLNRNKQDKNVVWDFPNKSDRGWKIFWKKLSGGTLIRDSILFHNSISQWKKGFPLCRETELVLSSSPWNENCLLMYMSRRHISWRLFTLLFSMQLWHINTNGQYDYGQYNGIFGHCFTR